MTEFATEEEFLKVVEKATRMGEDYNQLLSQITTYIKDNNINWFSPGLTELRFSVVGVFASTTTAMEDITSTEFPDRR